MADLFKTAAHAGFNVAAAEGSHLPQLQWDLDAVMKQQAQLALVSEAVGVGDQSKQDCTHKHDVHPHIHQTIIMDHSYKVHSFLLYKNSIHWNAPIYIFYIYINHMSTCRHAWNLWSQKWFHNVCEKVCLKKKVLSWVLNSDSCRVRRSGSLAGSEFQLDGVMKLNDCSPKDYKLGLRIFNRGTDMHTMKACPEKYLKIPKVSL